ncbi:glutamate 5-kinase [Sporomusa acidovorans]|uniref:Glutamate 5-kinase n=1 Tax=Sporomusa acidovorans (strain ATCC 49682 / DSM 3132 / Mol) TaxID=1123286 RepID=A0ABZ3J0S6_SPOA4|nr:glutamate 5-kinase [Sporomusa acidovorans]OZC22526.1 glutamate 5-kinase [Sporomusa acidovorans DSM 3132]SDE72945.1 glutamate 5-kinase [Sporomusa acidovorans]
MLTRENLSSAKRIVIKVGTSTLTHATGKLNLLRIEKLARELSDLANQGKQIILVSSGAVGAGMDRLGLKDKPKTIPEKQAAAAVGQGILLHIYEKMFGEYGQIVAQVLLTRADSVNRKRYTNSRNTLMALLNQGVIPIINENDAVAIDELKIGDNDTLSAMVASIIDADLLIILSDIEGVYTANPQTDPQAALVSEIADITPAIEDMAGGPGTLRGTGGMYTKIQAAKIAVNSGVTMVIASGGREGVVRDIIRGSKVGTIFMSKESRLHIRKRWLAFGVRVSGRVIVDKGCEAALLKEGSSLLAAGITAVEGNFELGNTISIVSVCGQELARGISNYSSDDVKKIKGAHTHEISMLLGSKPYDEVVHRDNLVLLV